MAHAFECGLEQEKWCFRVLNRAKLGDMVRQKNELVDLQSNGRLNLCVETRTAGNIVHINELHVVLQQR
jgi:hypothetical protein